MAIRYTNGIGKIYDKEIQQPISDVTYQLIETDKTKYTPKKWWGEFSAKREIKRLGNYILELDDGRKGECVIIANTEGGKGPGAHHHYRFNGRGALGRHLSFGG